MEFGDVFVTTDATPDAAIWAQSRTVMGTRVLGFGCSQNSPALGVVTEGTRLAAPGISAAVRDRPRLDRDVIRWIVPDSVRVTCMTHTSSSPPSPMLTLCPLCPVWFASCGGRPCPARKGMLPWSSPQ